MGILSKFFVSRPVDMESEQMRSAPHRVVPAIAANGITDRDLATLEACSTGVSRAKLIRKDGGSKLKCVWEGGDDGPWIYAFSPALTNRLAALADEEVASLGADWSAGLGDPKDFTQLLTGLRALALIAQGAQTKESPWSPHLWYTM
jgi:hypothetical protein